MRALPERPEGSEAGAGAALSPGPWLCSGAGRPRGAGGREKNEVLSLFSSYLLVDTIANSPLSHSLNLATAYSLARSEVVLNVMR